ncbi:MAG: PIN domain-containing protein [Solirubrobacteraceae bacterium]
MAEAVAGGAAVSAVNLSEVATVLVRHRQDPAVILAAVREQLKVEPFAADDALAAAGPYPLTSSRGLSLGDRACLALAQRLGVPAVTAEHAWAELGLEIEVRLIRSRSDPPSDSNPSHQRPCRRSTPLRSSESVGSRVTNPSGNGYTVAISSSSSAPLRSCGLRVYSRAS